jgi:hypothetical protein
MLRCVTVSSPAYKGKADANTRACRAAGRNLLDLRELMSRRKMRGVTVAGST